MIGNKVRELLERPIFDAIRNHTRIRLAETSDPFPRAFNPHADLGVEYKAVSVCTGTDLETGKGMMAKWAFYDAIENGFLTPDVTAVESSSGNTGPEMELVAPEVGVRFLLILSKSMPPEKFARANVLACDGVEILPLLGKTAQRAREIGSQPGFYALDQYGREWNPYAQYKFIAPQVFAGNEDAAAIFVLGGSCGTPLGFARYVLGAGLRTKVFMVVAAGKDNLSGGKNLAQVKSDILHNVFHVFPEAEIREAPRYLSNRLAWASWPHVVKRSRGLHFMFGQSFGATVYAAFNWVEARRKDGTLDSFRNKEGKVIVLTLGMDDYRSYIGIFNSEIEDEVLAGPRALPPRGLLFS